METIQENQATESDQDFLASGLRSIPGIDTAGYREAPTSEENTTLKTETQDRGTDDPESTSTPAEAGDKSSATPSKAEGNEVRNNQGQFKNRSQDRIQELLAQVKERDAKLAEYEKVKAAQVAQPPQTQSQAPQPQQQAPVMVPKPEYSADVLRGILNKKKKELLEATANGDLPKAYEVQEFMDSIAQKLQEAESWESRNKEAVERYNNAIRYYQEQVAKEMPDMLKADSPIRQEHAKVMSRFQEIQKNPALLEYEIASIANLRSKVGLHASEKAALEKQIQQLQQENTALKEKSKPLTQTEATSASPSENNEDEMSVLRRGLRDFRIPLSKM